MSLKLNNDDGCAVDLLLDRDGARHGGATACYVNAPSDAIRDRLNSVEGLLNELERAPATDPPANLLGRTLSRCFDRADAPEELIQSDTANARSPS